MTEFRGSSAGYCSRAIVNRVLHPEVTTIDPAKRPFLDAGHYLQEHVEDFLSEVLPSHFSLLPQYRESEGVHDMGSFTITGHVDGVLVDKSKKPEKYYLLEVKAIKENSYKKLGRTYDWRDLYGHYRFQAQTYLHFPRLVKGDLSLAKDLKGTHFVYYNRNTSEMCTSLPIRHPAVEVRDNMYEPKSAELFQQIVEKFQRCAEFIEAEDIPQTCDAVGYCYFCGTTGAGYLHVPKRRRVSLEGCDPEQAEIEDRMKEIAYLNEEISGFFSDFSADEIELESGVVLKKEDYA